MNARNERDEWLMAQVALGHREALEPLVRRYAGPLVGFIRRLVRDSHRGEELFQDVFLAVWQKRTQYQFPRPFKPWLYMIALNKCRADFRFSGTCQGRGRGLCRHHLSEGAAARIGAAAPRSRRGQRP